MPEQRPPFHVLLDGHLKAGTAPKPISGGWKVASFASHLGCSDRTVRNWTSGNRTPEPADFEAIETALFGATASADRDALRAAWEVAVARRGSPGRKPQGAETAIASPPSLRAPDRCFGRDGEIGDCVAALLDGPPAQSRALVVLGDGGIGKTTLKRQVAHDAGVRDRFGARIAEAELDTARNAGEMAARIAAALGVDPAQGVGAVLDDLGRTAPTLLLLDNTETPWEADRAGVEALLRRLLGVPGVALLASLRGREPPGGARWAHRCRLPPLPAEEARRLFLDIAGDHLAADPLLPGLLKELAGIPLAIELMAKLAAQEDGLAPLRAEWDRIGPPAARDPHASAEHRHASLARSIEVSLASPRLGAQGRRLFALLGAMPAGLADVDAPPLLGADAAEARRQLLSVGLALPRGERLDLLPPLRRHAQAAHPPAPEDAAAWVAHLLRLMAERGTAFLGGDGAGTVRRLGPEIPNLEAALRQADPLGLRPPALAAVWGFTILCRFTGTGGTALRDLAADCSRAEDRLGEASCVQAFADIARDRSNLDAARTGYDTALLIFRAIGSRLGEATCIRSLADIALHRPNHEAAWAGYVEALPIYREIGDRTGEAACVACLAEIALARSDYDAAQAGFEEARAIFRAIGTRLGEANCIRGLAAIALARSDYNAARSGYDEALPTYHEMGDRLGEANCILSLAQLALRRSDDDVAQAGYNEALRIFRAIGNRLGEANCLLGLAQIALRRRDHDTAQAGFEKTRKIFGNIGDRLGEANCAMSLARIAEDRNDLDAAQAGYNEALLIFRAIPNRLGEANCIFSLADIALARSDHDGARAGYDEALPIYRTIGNVVGEGITLARQGVLAALAGDNDTARRLFDTAIALFERVGSAGNLRQVRGLRDRLSL